MDSVAPETLVSDQDMALITCMEEMNESGGFQINHLYDSWHYLKSLKVKYESRWSGRDFKRSQETIAKKELFSLINADS